jgi:hypothetical protein
MDNDTEILNLLRKVANGEDRSREIARNLETAILARYPDADDDSRLEQLMYVLASYEPGGGEYLYNSEQLADECCRVLALLTES